MGREVKRVPLHFSFPIDKSYYDHQYVQHGLTCRRQDHDDCEIEMSPPKGDGWQLWQTVSDGPVTPVFATPEELIEYMSQPVPLKDRKLWCPEAYPEMPAGQGWHREVAEKFVRGMGWAPSFVMVNGQFVSGPEFVTSLSDKK